MKFFRTSVLLLSFFVATGAYAIAPVVDAYDETDDFSISSAEPTRSSTSTQDVEEQTRDVHENNKFAKQSSFSLEQRVSIQEQQIANLNPLLVQVDDLRQKMQLLQGKLEEQQHDLKLLQDQIRRQYQDLDKRLSTRVQASSNYSTVMDADSIITDEKTVHTNRSKSILTSKTPAKPIPGVPTALGERAYQGAFQLLKNKQYSLAIQRFEEFVKQHPTDINLPNANYFLGQLYLLQGEPEQSIIQFNHFTKTYPQDARVPDALLQLGLAYFAKGEKSTSMSTFKKIIQRYPDSKSAQVARARVQQFQAMISAANATNGTMGAKNNA